jgi:hypothetical protein
MSARLLAPAQFDVRLSEILECLGEIWAQSQCLVVGRNGLGVATLVAQSVAELVPGVGKGAAECDGAAKGALGCLPIPGHACPDAPVILAVGAWRGRRFAPLFDTR